MLTTLYRAIPKRLNFGEEFNRMFEEFFTPLEPQRNGLVADAPALNIWEEQNGYFIEAEVPGVKREDLHLEVVDRNLVINATRSAPSTQGVTRHSIGRLSGNIRRSVQMPANTDLEQITAELENGILSIRLPKRAETQPRRIEVK